MEEHLRTLNNRGRTSDLPNEYSQEFIAFSAACAEPVLDIGAGFGVATLPALEQGATVIANDIEPRHLEIIAEKTPTSWRARLVLIPGSFPDELDFDDESLGAVHASNLMNFLRGEEIVRGVAKIYRWLKPGGRIFIVAGTPYAGNIERFIPEYLARRAAGVAWPGEVENLRTFSSHPTIVELPNFLHLLDDEVLRGVILDAGFDIKACEMYLRANLPDYLKWDGRENVGLIAQKS